MHTYTPSSRQASRPALDTPSAKHRAAFGPGAIHALHEPGFEERRPDRGPRPLGKIAAEVVDLNLMRLAAALHRLGETIGADVGSRKDMLKRLAAPAHEVKP